MSENEKLKSLLREAVTLIKQADEELTELREQNKQLREEAQKKTDQEKQHDNEKKKLCTRPLQQRIREFQARHSLAPASTTVGNWNFEKKRWET